MTPVSQTGPGCVTDALSSPFSMARISPASRAGLDLTVAADSDPTPVTGTNPLYGVWLLKGTGTLFAVDSTGVSPAVPYRIDHNGTIDTAPDDRQPTEHLRRHDARERVRREYSFFPTVGSDPCNRFAGQTALQWLRIQ